MGAILTAIAVATRLQSSKMLQSDIDGKMLNGKYTDKRFLQKSVQAETCRLITQKTLGIAAPVGETGC
mgnify:FL=1